MALCVFAYDEIVVCPVCGTSDFTLLKPMGRLRCNNCKTSFTESELVEEAIVTINDFVRNHGITEKIPSQLEEVLSSSSYAEYANVSALTAMAAALQVLAYPEAATPGSWSRALKMVQAAMKRERSKSLLSD
ncbi:MAG TPA: hypothetical protein VH186_13920 [Chloroflexia bacterium]|nr:hypothetical protein [Chloroflexia bacterium]